MKTQTSLIVLESGKIGVFEKPDHFFSDHPDENQSEKYQAAIKEATDSAIECKDQYEAEYLLDKHFGEKCRMSKPFDNLKIGVYPIPGLSFTVEEKDCWDCVECDHPNDCKPKKLALLSLEGDKPQRPDLKKEGQREPTFAEYVGKKPLKSILDKLEYEYNWSLDKIDIIITKKAMQEYLSIFKADLIEKVEEMLKEPIITKSRYSTLNEILSLIKGN